MMESAILAKRIPLEPGEVVVGSLEELAVGEPVSAPLAPEGLSPLERGRDDVHASALRRAVLKVSTLAELSAPTRFVIAGDPESRKLG
jgi:hypothetical protein